MRAPGVDGSTTWEHDHFDIIIIIKAPTLNLARELGVPLIQPHIIWDPQV